MKSEYQTPPPIQTLKHRLAKTTEGLLLKAPISTAAGDKFCNIFHSFW